MKAITIRQPWASLIAHGYKKFETRSWATKHRGELAIHAGKKIDNDAVLMIAKDYPEIWHKISPLPTGCVVAIATLKNCYEIEFDNGRVELVERIGDYGTYADVDGMEIEGKEVKFGWYEEGRFAWKMMDVNQVNNIPAKGQQGLWNWEDKP